MILFIVLGMKLDICAVWSKEGGSDDHIKKNTLEGRWSEITKVTWFRRLEEVISKSDEGKKPWCSGLTYMGNEEL